MGEIEAALVTERLGALYPMVDEEKTPLPRSWSPSDKCPFLGLSQNNLRVTYRGQGKNHKDAGAVRTPHPIPSTCGIYYFEVRVVSKGRDGYMGIGLCARDVSMLRLPGWERGSYGYHGDDGNSFCSSGNGLSYGPTFSTGDVVGCGFNLVDASAFFTKNGHCLGAAFKDLPAELFPTVGLQTPGEILDANFGHEPFLFDITQEIRRVELRVSANILRFPLPSTKKETFDRLVSSYLVHQGFVGASEAFERATGVEGQSTPESIRRRQQLQLLVREGRVCEAMEVVESAYPDLLRKRPHLFFLLRLQRMLELIGAPGPVESVGGLVVATRRAPSRHPSPASNGAATGPSEDVEMAEGAHSANGASTHSNGAAARDMSSDSDSAASMDGEGENGTAVTPASALNLPIPAPVPTPPALHHSLPSLPGNLDVIIGIGKELRQFYEEHLSARPDSGKYERLMNDVFSLLAYQDPWACPMRHLLEPGQREPVASALNSAVLQEEGQPSRPALHTLIAHAHRLRDELSLQGKG